MGVRTKKGLQTKERGEHGGKRGGGRREREDPPQRANDEGTVGAMYQVVVQGRGTIPAEWKRITQERRNE